MPPWLIISGVIALITLVDLLVVYALVRAGWAELVQGFGYVEPEPGAVRRRFQTFKAGLYNFGWLVHVAVDENYLHLYPAAIVRWAGARPASIPWGCIAVVKPGKRMTKVKIGKATIIGPTWCLEMAGSPGA